MRNAENHETKGQTMPVIVNVRDVLQTEPGERLTGVKGILKVAFKPSAFGRGEKAGTIQNAYLQDIETAAEIKLKLWNRDDIGSLKGERIALIAKNGPKGISGLKTFMDDYKPESPELGIEVSEKAEIVILDAVGTPTASEEDEDEIPGAEAPDPEPEPEARPRASVPARAAKPAPAQVRAQAKAPAPAPARASVPPSPAKASPSWKSAGADMRRLGAHYAACLIEVVQHVMPVVHAKSGLAMNEETCHAAAMFMAISLMRDRDKLWSIPDHPWKGYGETGTAEAAEAGPDVGDGDNLP